ncbi:hypothetical protein [Bacillus velezensis]
MAETKKYVQIKKSPCRSIWYADKIGSIFPSLGTRENAYKVDSPDRALYIRKEDAELIITENRRPKTDERVLITEGLSSSGDYKTGDICTVRRVVDIYGTITVKEHSNFVIAREYEVIVNSEVKNEEADGMENVNQTVINNANTLFEKKDDKYFGYKSRFGDIVIGGVYSYRFVVQYSKTNQDVVVISGDENTVTTPVCTTLEERLWKPEKSAQVCRDEIVEQAKADVETLKKYGRTHGGKPFDYRLEMFCVKSEFIVNRDKRTVVVLLKGAGTELVYVRGIAKAAPSDCFNVHIGRAIALRRALGLTVPDEYLNAPQPTEVRVGDVVRGKYADYYYQLCREGELGDDSYEAKIREIADGKYRYVGGSYDFIDDADLTIIDDSREEVGE